MCTGATALTLDTGGVVILEFGKILLFDNWMKRLFIDLNQFRYYVVNKCDGPTDKYHTVGVENNHIFTHEIVWYSIWIYITVT